SRGNLWIGTYDSGLNHFNPKTQKFTHYRHQPGDANSLSDDNIMSLLEDSQGNLWVGTGGGLNQFNPKTQQFTHYRNQAGDVNSLSDDDVWSFIEDSQGDFWVGTRGGLNHFNPKTQQFTHYHHQAGDANSLSDDNVYSLLEDSQGNLWVGTPDGLNLFNKNTANFTHFTTKNGLPNNVIYRIEEDKQGNIWLSTNQGLSRMNPKAETFRNYDVGDGLQSNEFNGGASFKSKNGELFFGGINGFNRFTPENIIDDKQAPIVLITAMFLLNESVPIVPLLSNHNPILEQSTETKLLTISSSSNAVDELEGFSLTQAIHVTKAITLTYKDNIIAFEFAALHFSNPTKNQFAYQLVGWDKDWVSTDYKNRRATYTNLPNGDYTFRVKASNADGYWNEDGASLKITVLPPPWKTWWAYTLYGLFLLTLVVAFIHSQRKKVLFERNINAQLEHKVVERTSELKAQKDEVEEKNKKIEAQKSEVEVKNQKIEAQKNEVEEKNKEILATQKQLIQSSKMASIGTMTAGVAHEINNPTNFAHAAAYMMKDEIIKIKAFLKQLAGGDKAESEVLQSFDEQFTKLIELTKTTTEGTARIKTIVEDLRTFARIDDVKHEQVQISDLINSTVHLVRTQYDSITIDTEFDYEPLFKCFPSKLNQVFMNIIVNACQAIENKKSSISNFEGKVVIKTNQYEDQLIMSFEDNGCGMIEETINRIYEPFFTTKDVGSGTGLGMAISFGIIDEHGGSINIESEIDKGTKVIIKLDV
ncbi:MAG: ATP-binding protein, partial [Colwellia sp.]|nr:ATP-binding protein [Colwellia sp.]